MAAQANEQPIIIKRKKKGGGDGHHGGAWKVAYADFVTAMMAFFMLMWLLNATTEKQRKGIADYFAPTISVNRVSGGGDGAFNGDSVFTEKTLSRNGTGATAANPAEKNQGSNGGDALEELLKSVEEELRGRGGESDVADETLKHIVTKVTDEGVVIEVFSLPDAQIFEKESAEPTQLLRDITAVVGEVLKRHTNMISIGGHVPSVPIVREGADLWKLSGDQATTMRELLEAVRIPTWRIERVAGHADREQTEDDPLDIRNNRLEIIMMRE